MNKYFVFYVICDIKIYLKHFTCHTVDDKCKNLSIEFALI